MIRTLVTLVVVLAVGAVVFLCAVGLLTVLSIFGGGLT